MNSESQISKEFESDVIHVYATFSDADQKPLVFWHLNETEGTLTLTEARARAEGLLTAAAMAEAEARIAIGLSGVAEAQKGFGNTDEKRKSDRAFQKMRTAMKLLRAPLSEGVEVIFGQTSRLPLVNIFWYGEPIQLPTALVRDHAYGLLRCAESAESDRFFYKFLTELTGVSAKEVSGLLQEFSEYRDRQQLSDLLKLDIERS